MNYYQLDCDIIIEWLEKADIIPESESVDSLCRDGVGMPRPPYIGKACTCLNSTFVSLFSCLTVVLKCFCT